MSVCGAVSGRTVIQIGEEGTSATGSVTILSLPADAHLCGVVDQDVDARKATSQCPAESLNLLYVGQFERAENLESLLPVAKVGLKLRDTM